MTIFRRSAPKSDDPHASQHEHQSPYEAFAAHANEASSSTYSDSSDEDADAEQPFIRSHISMLVPTLVLDAELFCDSTLEEMYKAETRPRVSVELRHIVSGIVVAWSAVPNEGRNMLTAQRVVWEARRVLWDDLASSDKNKAEPVQWSLGANGRFVGSLDDSQRNGSVVVDGLREDERRLMEPYVSSFGSQMISQQASTDQGRE